MLDRLGTRVARDHRDSSRLPSLSSRPRTAEMIQITSWAPQYSLRRERPEKSA